MFIVKLILPNLTSFALQRVALNQNNCIWKNYYLESWKWNLCSVYVKKMYIWTSDELVKTFICLFSLHVKRSIDVAY